MKTCFKCGRSLQLSQFYAHPKMRDGHLGKCIQCTKSDTKARTTRLQQTDPDWVEKELQRQRKKQARYRALGLASPPSREARDNYAQRNPHKTSAIAAANNAVRDGRLIKKPCEVCGDPVAQKHHDDYTKPLDVRWLCAKHHAERHVWLRQQARLLAAQTPMAA